jgi:nucleoside-diphosphate-sugar epimerase
MNVLVTGGAGLIGMAVRDALAARGHKVTAIDITDYGRGDKGLIFVGLDAREPLEALIDAEAIEAIVHAGAISGPMLAKGRPLLLVSANIDGTAMLLDLARVRGMRRFVFCSSISVYGSVGKDLIGEERPLHPTSVYGATKVACEQLIEGFAAEFGLNGVSLRIGRVYGPYRRANCHLGGIIRDARARHRDCLLAGFPLPLCLCRRCRRRHCDGPRRERHSLSRVQCRRRASALNAGDRCDRAADHPQCRYPPRRRGGRCPRCPDRLRPVADPERTRVGADA